MTDGLFFFSFLAGVLTILAPCVLPVLPVIIGGSISEGRSWLRAVIITVSLAASLIFFTLILKLSSALLSIPPEVWKYISADIIIFFGVITLFPTLWDHLTVWLGFQRASDSLLSRTAKKRGWVGAVMIGLALGPVFSSCSPTYALILATVLPVDFSLGLIYLTLYATGLALMLLIISLLGQRLTSKLRWAVAPNSWFKRFLGVLFILVGLSILTGWDKRLEAWLVANNIINVSQLELSFLLPQSNSDSTQMNIREPYQAPELVGLSGWINSEPITLADLRGKVVVVDFWTYSCINCIRTIPFLNEWDERYRKDGLVIIGVHSPEFAFEKVRANVEEAVTDFAIKYPVALDNDFNTWRAYDNRFWPAKYFIDKQGRVRHTHFGEGQYMESEAIIRALLAEDGGVITDQPIQIEIEKNEAPVRRGQTPELYLGLYRASNHKLQPIPQLSTRTNYDLQSVGLHQWSLGGSWRIEDEESISEHSGAVLRLKFAAKDVYLVMGSGKEVQVSARLNGRELTSTNGGGADVGEDGKIRVEGSRLYHIVSLPEFIEGSELEIIFPAGVTINAFTFGS